MQTYIKNIDLCKRDRHIKGQKHRSTHSHAVLSLCSACESVRPQQGPPVLSWSPPIWPQATLCSQAAHHSLHTANRRVRGENPDFFLKGTMPTCDSSSLTSSLSTHAGATTGTDKGVIKEFKLLSSTKCICCLSNFHQP